MSASGWVLAIVLTVVLPDGSAAESRGRANPTFTLEACLGELQRFHAGLLPPIAPGARVVAVRAACVPESLPRDAAPRTPPPGARGRDHAA